MKRLFSLILVLVIAFNLYIPVFAFPSFSDSLSNSDLVNLWSGTTYSYVFGGSVAGGSLSDFMPLSLLKNTYSSLIGSSAPVPDYSILYQDSDEYGDYFYTNLRLTFSVPLISNVSSFYLPFYISAYQMVFSSGSSLNVGGVFDSLVVRVYDGGDLLSIYNVSRSSSIPSFSESVVSLMNGVHFDIPVVKPFSDVSLSSSPVGVSAGSSSVILYLRAEDFGLKSFSNLNFDFSFSYKTYEDEFSVSYSSGRRADVFYPIIIPVNLQYNPSSSDMLELLNLLEGIQNSLNDVDDNITGFRQDIMTPSSSQVSQASAQNSVLSSASDLISSIGSEIDITLSPEQSNDISSQFAFVQGVGDEVSSAIGDPGSPLALISACFNSGSKTFSGFGFIVWAILLCMTLALISIILYGFKAKGG